FTDSEKSFLIEASNRFVLSEVNESLAADGNSDFYAFHTVNEASRGEGSAVGAYCEDTVFLPDLTTVCTLRAAGFILPETWCETPYFSNGEMVRTLAANGDIFMRDADEAYHVAPCITVSLSEADISGQGSFSHPFELR
ncbi:MAG: hypothetical protein HUJ65_01235, partial [Oscillospiraceae bacterium]|nr:hypothetical protein [Oscillospiraceae bacterium]